MTGNDWEYRLKRLLVSFFSRVYKVHKHGEFKKKPKQSTLRTVVYTLATFIQLIWVIWVSVIITQSFVTFIQELMTEGLKQKDYLDLSGFFNFLLQALLMLFLPLDLILPPLMPTRSARSKCRLTLHSIIGITALLYSSAGVAFIAQLQEEDRENTLKMVYHYMILFFQLLVTTMLCGSLIYLSVYNRNNRIHVKTQEEAAEFAGRQGNIHCAQLFLVVALTLLLAIDEGFEIDVLIVSPFGKALGQNQTDHGASDERFHSYFNYRTLDNNSDGERVNELLWINGTFQRLSIEDDERRFQAVGNFGYLKPWFLVTIMLLIQIRHYTFVHHDFHNPTGAKKRLEQFKEQYSMTPLERDVANRKEWYKFLLDYICMSSAYPRCFPNCNCCCCEC